MVWPVGSCIRLAVCVLLDDKRFTGQETCQLPVDVCLCEAEIDRMRVSFCMFAEPACVWMCITAFDVPV